jgi:hypothetical protein
LSVTHSHGRVMPIPIIEIHPASSDAQRATARELLARGVFVERIPSTTRAGGRPASTAYWCLVRDDMGIARTGAVLTVAQSRKLPWIGLGRIRLAARLVEELGVSGMATLADRIRQDIPGVARLGLRLYATCESRLSRLETIVQRAGFAAEPAEKDYQRTALVSLSGDEEALMARLAYSARRGIRNAEKGHWSVRCITDTSSADRLQVLHEAAHGRTGGHAASLDLATAVTESQQDGANSVVFGVFHPDRTEKDALVGFVHGVTTEESVIYSTAGTERAPDIGAAPLGYGLVWALMSWGQRRGLPWFDFGGITPEDQPDHPLARISEFKRKFRGEEVRIASDWFLDIAPMQARLLDAAGRAAGLLRRS